MATDEAVFLLQKPSPAKPGTVFQKMWCRQWDLNPHGIATTGF